MMKATVLLLCCSSAALALEVTFSTDYAAYSISHGDTTLFKAERGIAVFVDGAWHSTKDGSLSLAGHKTVSGAHPSLGNFTGLEISWLAGNTPFVTTAKTYATGRDVSFVTSFPHGAVKTSLVDYHNTTRDEVIANFPAFNDIALPDALSWAGSFVQPVQGRSNGPTGGPTVFFDASDALRSTVVVGSAMNHFKASSAGPGTAWDGTDAWVPGTAGTIREIEPGFEHEFLLHVSQQGAGITATVGEWGQVLQATYATRKMLDVTLSKIGYQTDNGAMYVFCSRVASNCSALLLEELATLKKQGVPMGYLSFQGAGASTVHSDAKGMVSGGDDPTHAAPWCVNTWGPDLDGNGAYPLPLKPFQEALGVPLQLYAPYFCPESMYFSRNNASSPWVSVISNTSYDGCSFYGFQDAAPHQSRAFYDWFFAKGTDVGMVSFEPDFMNQNYNCVPEFVHSTSNATIWQHGMADAAKAVNVAVQWCYAAPTDVLGSLDMDAVTNFRVSMDFCYGRSWDIGTSSLLVWALGAAPSKDTLWTSNNNRTEVPGCPWTPDHETPAAPLHVVLALMSTGPVGISDALGFTNAPLIKRTITADGTLLKPSKPVTSVDSSLVGGEAAPKGNVYATYSSCASSMDPDSDTDVTNVQVHAYQFVSFQLKQPWSVPPMDFYPPIKNSQQYVQRAFGAACTNGTDASSCVKPALGTKQPVTLPKSDFSNVTGGTDYAPAVTTVWPVCAQSGWVILGELDKYVPLSPLRFSNVLCTAGGVSATVHGSAGEIVPVTLLRPSATGEAAAVVLTTNVKLSSKRSTLVTWQ